MQDWETNSFSIHFVIVFVSFSLIYVFLILFGFSRDGKSSFSSAIFAGISLILACEPLPFYRFRCEKPLCISVHEFAESQFAVECAYLAELECSKILDHLPASQEFEVSDFASAIKLEVVSRLS